MIQLSLSSIPDDAIRRRLMAVPTSLTIPDADVDALVDQGRTLIATNPTLLGLLADFAPASDTTIAASEAGDGLAN
jgi:hypothetical protein